MKDNSLKTVIFLLFNCLQAFDGGGILEPENDKEECKRMLKLMDCTLRDGANVVGKGFDAEITKIVLDILTKA